MRRIPPPRLLALLLFAGLLPPGPGARAQEERPFAPDQTQIRLEVRAEGDLFTRGSAVADAWAAWVPAQTSPGDVEEEPDRYRTARTDAAGRARLPLRRDGDDAAFLLVWAQGRAPRVVNAPGGGDLPLTLDTAVTLAGVVSGPDGAPVPGAVVEAEVALPLIDADDGSGDSYRYRSRARTDGDGAFALPGLCRESVLDLRAAGAGLAPVTRFPVQADGPALSLLLLRGASVSGRAVLVPGNRPAEGAIVRVAGAETTLDVEGRFLLEALPPGPTELSVEGRGFVRPAPRALVLADGATRDDLVLQLARGATLEGVVLDHRGGVPERIEIRLTWPPLVSGLGEPAAAGLPEGPFRIEPDDAGRFRVEDLPPAAGVAIEVRTDGFVPVLVEGIVLRPGEPSALVEVSLRPGAVVRGRVTTTDGSGLPGAAVEAWPAAGAAARALASAASGLDGRFTLGGVPGGNVHLRVVPRPGALAPSAFGPFTLAEDHLTEAGDLALSVGHVLHGVVIGAPDGSVIRAVPDREGAPRATAVVHAETFNLEGLLPGRYRIEAAFGEGGAGGAAAVDAEVPLTGTVELLWLREAVVRGLLLDAGGSAVAVATLRAEQLDLLLDPYASGTPGADRSRTWEHRDATGGFGVTLTEGRWRIAAGSPEGLFGAVELDVGRDRTPEVRLVLRTGETVRGHAVGRDTGRALEGARVRVLPLGADPESSTPEATVGASGFFAVPGVPPGAVRVRIEAAGYPAHETEPIVVRRAAVPDVGRVEVPAGAILSGTVRRADGAPAAGSVVRVVDRDGGQTTTRVDRYGRYAVRGIRPGRTVIGVDDVLGGTVRTQFHRVFRGENRLDLDLGHGTVLRGRVTVAGRGEPFARVRAWSLGLLAAEVVSGADAVGRFELAALPPGPVDLEVTTPGGGTPWLTRFVLERAADQFVQLDLPEGYVAGEVRAERGGDRIAGAFVRLVTGGRFGQEREVARAVTDAEGRFRLQHVPAGRYRLDVNRPGFGPRSEPDFVVEPRSVRDGVLLLLPEEAVVTLRVLDDRRRPVPGAFVVAVPGRGGGDLAEIRARADGSGQVRIAGLTGGIWRLATGAPGYGTLHAGVVDLVPGDRYDAGDFLLEPGTALRVHVVGPLFLPVAGAVVHVEDVLGNDPRLADRRDHPLLGGDRAFVTDGEGEILVPDLMPGSYRVWLDGNDEEFRRVRVDADRVATVWLPAR